MNETSVFQCDKIVPAAASKVRSKCYIQAFLTILRVDCLFLFVFLSLSLSLCIALDKSIL